MATRREAIAAVMLVPLIAFVGRCSATAPRHVPGMVAETAVATGKGAARGAMHEYSRRE